MDKLEQAIKDVELGLRIAKGTDCGLFKTSVKSAEQILELLKEQKAIIDQYHQADTFLAVHGWQWKRTTTDSGTSQKDGDGE